MRTERKGAGIGPTGGGSMGEEVFSIEGRLHLFNCCLRRATAGAGQPRCAPTGRAAPLQGPPRRLRVATAFPCSAEAAAAGASSATRTVPRRAGSWSGRRGLQRRPASPCLPLPPSLRPRRRPPARWSPAPAAPQEPSAPGTALSPLPEVRQGAQKARKSPVAGARSRLELSKGLLGWLEGARAVLLPWPWEGSSDPI